MRNLKFCHNAFQAGLYFTFIAIGACNLPEPPQANNAIPADYAKKHMPKDWWNNDAIIEEGRQLYLGKKQGNVDCSNCHGKNGKPTRTSAPDFRNTDSMKKYSDSHLFWRISEGVAYSTMKAFKETLSEDEIWKVILFVSTLGMDGLRYDPDAKDWVPNG